MTKDTWGIDPKTLRLPAKDEKFEAPTIIEPPAHPTDLPKEDDNG